LPIGLVLQRVTLIVVNRARLASVMLCAVQYRPGPLRRACWHVLPDGPQITEP